MPPAPSWDEKLMLPWSFFSRNTSVFLWLLQFVCMNSFTLWIFCSKIFVACIECLMICSQRRLTIKSLTKNLSSKTNYYLQSQLFHLYSVSIQSKIKMLCLFVCFNNRCDTEFSFCWYVGGKIKLFGNFKAVMFLLGGV